MNHPSPIRTAHPVARVSNARRVLAAESEFAESGYLLDVSARTVNADVHVLSLIASKLAEQAADLEPLFARLQLARDVRCDDGPIYRVNLDADLIARIVAEALGGTLEPNAGRLLVAQVEEAVGL